MIQKKYQYHLNLTTEKLQQIIDRETQWTGWQPKARTKILKQFTEEFSKEKKAIYQYFSEGKISAFNVTRLYADLTDILIKILYQSAVKLYHISNPSPGDRLTVVAIGGYGQQKMAPFSDIDLLFIIPWKETPNTEKIIEFILYFLWDMKLKIGHSCRTVSRCISIANEDFSVRTALLYARYIDGNYPLFETLKAHYKQKIITGSEHWFATTILNERRKRHKHMGESRYLLEPDIKEGQGGLRDLQALFWIVRYYYGTDSLEKLIEIGFFTKAESARLKKIAHYLWTVRIYLHVLNKRPGDRLTFPMQRMIAEQMQYRDSQSAEKVERFMRHYFLTAREVGQLSHIFSTLLRERTSLEKEDTLEKYTYIEGFPLKKGQLTVEKIDEMLEKTPLEALRIFFVARKRNLEVSPAFLRYLKRYRKPFETALKAQENLHKSFLQIFLSPHCTESTLRDLSEQGILEMCIPEFASIKAQMQHDMYHVYTTDEHTIRALGHLFKLEQGQLKKDHPLSSQVIKEISSRTTLYMAVLLHDIAKGKGGEHSKKGALIAQSVCQRMKLDQWEEETVTWLVRNHLYMSRSAFKRDLSDPETSREFARLVTTPERLRLLFLLTVVDIKAVGPSVWNSWKGNLLSELFWRTMEQLTGRTTPQRLQAQIINAQKRLYDRLEDWPEDKKKNHLALGTPLYWRLFNTDSHEYHARFIAEAENNNINPAISAFIDPEKDTSEVIVHTHDRAGLFALIAGALALSRVSIIDARVFVLNNGMVIDTFTFVDHKGNPVDDEAYLSRICERIRQTLYDKRISEEQMRTIILQNIKNHGTFTVPTKVIVHPEVSLSHTVIEASGRNRPGLLYDLARTLTRLNLKIGSAFIATYGERATDVFYVKNCFGLKITSTQQFKNIKKELQNVFSLYETL